MKTADEILEIILRTIAGIYKRPRMYGGTAGEVDNALWHYHLLWVEITERDIDVFRDALTTVHGRRHRCNTSFCNHYRNHTARGASASEDEVTDFAIGRWKKLDGILGMVVPDA